VIATPGTAPPEESRTTPNKVPVLVWASIARAKAQKRTALLSIVPPQWHRFYDFSRHLHSRVKIAHVTVFLSTRTLSAQMWIFVDRERNGNRSELSSFVPASISTPRESVNICLRRHTFGLGCR